VIAVADDREEDDFWQRIAPRARYGAHHGSFEAICIVERTAKATRG